MPPEFDVIIVGAGPAGSATAFTAAEQGVSVLLLEEHPKIGVPVVCAEGITTGSVQNYLAIEPEWVASFISGAYVRSPDGEQFRINHPRAGYVLDRKIFDAALAKMAEQRGAVVKTSAKAIGIEENEVIVNESGERRRYRYKFLIGADGVASRVGTWMGINTRLNMQEVLVCAQYVIDNLQLEPQYITIIYSNATAPGGYAWIFPKSAHSANVGVGISPLKTRQKAKYFLDDWVQREFSHGQIKSRVFGGVPIKPMKIFSGDNFFLVGDAARLGDPLTGGGIANGIKSGVIAGRNCVLRLRGKKDHFEEEIKKEILDAITFHFKVRKGFLKFTDKELIRFYKQCKKTYGERLVTHISMRQFVRLIALSSPRIMWRALKVLF